MVMPLTQSAPSTSRKSLPELDIEIFTFVERYATNLLRWDLLMFFGVNPERRLTVAELARAVRRSLRATKKELDDLTYLRVLTRRYTPQKTTYQLTRRGPARRAVLRLGAYARDTSRQGSK
jgi:hypothetical protein